MPRHLFTKVLCQAALLWLSVAPAHAVVTTTAPSNWLGSSDARLDGVGKFTSGGTLCSASLLAGGAYAITAAHCVSGGAPGVNVSSGQVAFKGGTVTATFSSSAQVSVFPTWAGEGANGEGLGFNNDIALIALDTTVTQISGYQILPMDPLGLPVLLAGFGLTGVGETGFEAGTGGTLHWGSNVYDALLSGPGSSYVFDFDNGQAANNLMGGLGLGVYEASIAPGDSGGSTFADISGTLWLVGVHSFIGRDDAGTTDIDAVQNSTYGEFAGDTALYTSANLAWINSVVAVPEPASALLSLAGLSLVGGVVGRQRRGRRSGTA